MNPTFQEVNTGNYEMVVSIIGQNSYSDSLKKKVGKILEKILQDV